MISGTNITVIVSGSIAAYKACELIRELVRQGAKVNVVMTKAATEFITQTTLQTVSENQVLVDLFGAEQDWSAHHIRLADSSDLIVVAPATANIIAKTAAGIADDLASSLLLAAKAKKVFIPAMNSNMWSNSITRRNVETLKSHGIFVMQPEYGELACGIVGPGRFPDCQTIIEQIQYVLSPKDLTGSRVIVTAGPTREMLDPIRFISNSSSGRMGYALASIAAWRGAEVYLVSGPSELAPPLGVEFRKVTTAEEMRDVVMHLVSRPMAGSIEQRSKAKQLVFMAAAVSDHRPEEVSKTKLKRDKTKPYDLRLVPAPDILKELGETRREIEAGSGCALKLVGFTAETGDEEELLAWAKEKLERKNADLMVGNFAEDAFGKDTNRVWLLERGGRQEEVATADKKFIARKIIKASLRV